MHLALIPANNHPAAVVAPVAATPTTTTHRGKVGAHIHATPHLTRPALLARPLARVRHHPHRAPKASPRQPWLQLAHSRALNTRRAKRRPCACVVVRAAAAQGCGAGVPWRRWLAGSERSVRSVMLQLQLVGVCPRAGQGWGWQPGQTGTSRAVACVRVWVTRGLALRSSARVQPGAAACSVGCAACVSGNRRGCHTSRS